MSLTRSAFLLCLYIVYTKSEAINKTEVQLVSKKQDDVPNTKLFDVRGIINQLFPGFNQGIQGGFGGNPGGSDFPANSQFYPAVSIQGQGPSNSWPIIDDAKQYPNQGNFGGTPQNQYPNQGNFGGTPQNQYPNQGNFGGRPQNQYPNQGNFGDKLQNQYPNQGNFGSTPQNQYPNQGNFGGTPQNQYPNQGNFGSTPQNQYPNQGNFGGTPQNQYPNQGNFGGTPQNQYPNQGNFGDKPQNQYPNQGNFAGTQQNQYPNQGNFGGTPQNQYPIQGNFGGLNQNLKPGQPSDGTLDSMVPPLQQSPQWNYDNPPTQLPNNMQNRPPTQLPGDNEEQYGNVAGDGPPAILGRPVIVPMTTPPAGLITFPSSTENPVLRQCVQDCETTSEYNPVCGSNNVTYINPGKFVCARNCGVDVFVSERGRCPGDGPNPKTVMLQPGQRAILQQK